MAGSAGLVIMGKQQEQTLTQLLDSLLRQTSDRIQSYRQRRQQIAALAPRKARLLWWLPIPLIPATIISLVSGQFMAFVVNAGAYSLFLAGAALAHHGFQKEIEQRQQQFQTTFLWPFKALGGLTVAFATFLTAWAAAGYSLLPALAFGVGAFTAFVLLYGLDPRRQPVLVEKRDGNTERVSKALQQAEQKIISIEQAHQQITQPELKQHLMRIIALARQILAEIARDPRDIRRARKFLNTYLDGTQRVVSGFAEAHIQGQAHSLEANFRRILITIEEVFEQQYQKLQENDLSDLDVQMEVLETQLKREGL